MDYKKALESRDPAKELQAMTVAYNFERDLLKKCKERRLSRIIRVLDDGTLQPQDGDPSSVVQYLIFELADGDIRSYIDTEKAFGLAWALRTIHQTAAALQQLHSVEIAHQDVKPSNVLIFQNNSSKLADLGRASERHSTSPSPHDALKCAGDQTYAPPELLYGHAPQDWRVRRLGCDMYLLGSLVVFFCTGVSMTHLLFKRLDESFHFDKWNDPYSQVLPHIQKVFTQVIRELPQVIRELQGGELPSDFAEDIADAIGQLCNPDTESRGHPKNLGYGSNRYSIERYVSLFDRLAKQAEWSLTRREPIRRSN